MSCIKRCPLRTSRSNWRNTGRWQRWQICDSTMRAIQNHRWCYFSFLGLLIQITREGLVLSLLLMPHLYPLYLPMSSEVTISNIYTFLVASQLKRLSPASFLRVFSAWEYGSGEWQRSLLSSQVGWPVMR